MDQGMVMSLLTSMVTAVGKKMMKRADHWKVRECAALCVGRIMVSDSNKKLQDAVLATKLRRQCLEQTDKVRATFDTKVNILDQINRSVAVAR